MKIYVVLEENWYTTNVVGVFIDERMAIKERDKRVTDRYIKESVLEY